MFLPLVNSGVSRAFCPQFGERLEIDLFHTHVVTAVIIEDNAGSTSVTQFAVEYMSDTNQWIESAIIAGVPAGASSIYR